MKNKLPDYFSIEFLKFLVVSGFAAVVNFVSRIIIDIFTSYGIAIVLAYLVGMVTAFALNKLFVFQKGKKHSAKQFMIFTLVNIAAILQTLVISILLRDYFFPYIGFNFHTDEVAHIIGLGVPAFTSYLGHKYFSFK